jgi:ABC-type amino acid transport system permease subunit
MQELEITWQRAVRIWWAWLWRALALSLVCGGVIGFAIGFFGAMLGFRNIDPLITVVGLVVGVVAGVAMLVTALKKKYPGFRVALVAQNETLP